MALGIASLTVEEQATTFATLADGGEYVTPHVVAKITEQRRHASRSKLTRRQVLTPAQAADVDYALSADTSPGGTAFPNGVLSPERPTIGKTGTTDEAQSAFFIGAVPQYSLAVGMFTNSQNGKLRPGQTLNILPSVNGQRRRLRRRLARRRSGSTFMQQRSSVTCRSRQLPTPDYDGFDKWIQVPPTAEAEAEPDAVPSGPAAPVRAAVPARRHDPESVSRRHRTRSGRRRPTCSPTSPFGG